MRVTFREQPPVSTTATQKVAPMSTRNPVFIILPTILNTKAKHQVKRQKSIVLRRPLVKPLAGPEPRRQVPRPRFSCKRSGGGEYKCSHFSRQISSKVCIYLKIYEAHVIDVGYGKLFIVVCSYP